MVFPDIGQVPGEIFVTKTLREMAYAWTAATNVEMLISPMAPGQFPGCEW